MYINVNQEKWEKLHEKSQFRLKFPNETVIRFIKGNFRGMEQARILDLGCGAGRHVVFMAKEGIQVTGIDFSREGLDFTAEMLQENGLQAELVQGSIVSLPFEDETFDGIVSVAVIYYFVRSDIDLIAQEIYRTLKPGGKAFLVVRTTEDRRYGKGEEVETRTFRMTSDFSNEETMTIHFFTEEEIRDVFRSFSNVTIGFHREGYGSLTDIDSDYLITLTK